MNRGYGAAVFLILFMVLSVLAEEEFSVDPGILPDSPFYALDQFFERPGDDPEKALAYQQEKLAEAQAMAEKDKAELTQRALEKATEYGLLLEREITPEMEEKIKASSAQTTKVLERISEQLPEVQEQVQNQVEQQKRIALAADVATKIKQLCETLATLDPLQYEKTCKNDDTPQWQQDLDKELTKDQKAQALVFKEKLRECFMSRGKNCDCEGIGVQKFTELCLREKEISSQCQDGNQEACAHDGPTDFTDVLPDYLIDVVKELEEESEDEFEREEREFDGEEEGKKKRPGEKMYNPEEMYKPEDNDQLLKDCQQYRSEEECQQMAERMQQRFLEGEGSEGESPGMRRGPPERMQFPEGMPFPQEGMPRPPERMVPPEGQPMMPPEGENSGGYAAYRPEERMPSPDEYQRYQERDSQYQQEGEYDDEEYDNEEGSDSSQDRDDDSEHSSGESSESSEESQEAPPTGSATGVFDEPAVATWFANFMGIRG